jgi:putative heme iron utilization protein|tara:strand:- start:1010 stop:1594 length:585 start_codon:yes stop_codon:yes gene_type:complete
MEKNKIENTAASPLAEGQEFAEAQAGYEALLNEFQSIQLGTADQTGVPEASYSPSIVDEGRNFYVHVSELASHTSNLRDSARASVLIIEDESTAENLFARKRVAYQCSASLIERHSDQWESVIDQFEEKFGKIVGFLKTMEDFHLFKLTPTSGRLVLGFGQAYDISGTGMKDLSHVGASSGKNSNQGHRKEVKK